MPKDRSGEIGTAGGGATIVTQTRPSAGQEEVFRRWQDTIGAEIAKWPCFLEQKVMPPSPPAQMDWVILQRFSSVEAAAAWLHSGERLRLVDSIQSSLAGIDDVHVVRDGASGVLPAAASAVISTHVKDGQEVSYRRWEQRIAAAQARAPGFQGYRLEPPVAGVQDDWLAIIRFDSDHNLENWLKSPERLKLLKDSESLIDRVDARIVRSGFDQWFSGGKSGAPAPPVWKQNMIVLLQLYPLVFLFGMFVQQPLLVERMKMPFWLALFIGNVVGVVLLNWLVPWASNRFGWWLQPAGQAMKTHILGAGVVIGLYAAWLLAFSRL
jgi:antibiotic biosynthesis monooxygenase (ABM) superfamily enzyme